jgi:dTMP kinase
MGILIVFEGIDGAGKTTQVNLLGEALRAAGESPVVSKEPTDGQWGRRLRESAQNGRMPLDEELATFVLDREEHARDVVLPALERNQIVILDRYLYSTIAYQGARGADFAAMQEQMRHFRRPDVTFLMDADPVVTLCRIAHGRCERPNEFEKRDYLCHVRCIFNELEETEPSMVRLDAHQSIQELHRKILDVLIDGAFSAFKVKQYEHDCWSGLCSFGSTDNCRWLNLQAALRAKQMATA